MICKLHAHIKMNNVHFVQDVTSLFKIGICSHLARYEKCYEVEPEKRLISIPEVGYTW